MKQQLLNLRCILFTIKKGASSQEHIKTSLLGVRNNISVVHQSIPVQSVIGKADTAPKRVMKKRDNLIRM